MGADFRHALPPTSAKRGDFRQKLPPPSRARKIFDFLAEVGVPPNIRHLSAPNGARWRMFAFDGERGMTDQRKSGTPLPRPISELLDKPMPPMCGARLATWDWSHDDCIRPVKAEGERCWQHQ
jgi:hypothetical protein